LKKLFCLLSMINDTNLKEDQIIEAVKNGSREVIKRLYIENRAGFIRFVVQKYSVPNDVVEDFYQDAFIALIENIKKGKLDDLKSSIKTYLFSIGKFMTFKYYKKPQMSVVEFSDFEELLEDESDEEERDEALIQLIQSKLQQMGDSCRKILTLFYYEEKKIEDIVKMGDYANKDVVKSQKSRCLSHLKKLVHGK
jgi:RNA polymerase sigma factor (sigma-70 family)